MLGRAALVLLPLAASGSVSCGGGSCQAPSELEVDPQSLMQLRQQSPGGSGERSCDLPTKACHMEEEAGCGLRGMSLHNTYAVHPGRGTACLNSSAPFYFRVKRGNPTKLLFVMEHGGACWDQASFDRDPFYGCKKEPGPGMWGGMMNHSHKDNPYHGYTIVSVPSCAGDLFAGNAHQPWGPGGSTVPQSGYNNTKAALEWSLKEFPVLTKFALLGSSAGGMGLQYWTDAILAKFEDRKARAVVYSDSFVGQTNPGPAMLPYVQGAINAIWKVCGNSALDAEAQAACAAQTFTWQGQFAAAMRRHPTARFAMLSSKTDAVQVAFNTLFGPPYSQETFYRDATLVAKSFAEHPNFRAYFVDGAAHVLLSTSIFYTGSTLGPQSLEGEPSISSWVHGFEDCKAPTPGHACAGDTANVTSRDQPLPTGTTWCDVVFA